MWTDEFSVNLEGSENPAEGHSPSSPPRQQKRKRHHADTEEPAAQRDASPDANIELQLLTTTDGEFNLSNEVEDMISALEQSLEDTTTTNNNVDDGSKSKKRKTRKTWEQRFQELKAYKSEHGDCLVPRMYERDPSLGRWVEMQRSNYHRYMKEKQSGRETTTACGGMNEERIALLEAEDFYWTFGRGMSSRKRDNQKPASSWLERFEELKQFRNMHGHCNVPVKYKENPKLGSWVSNQRSQYHRFQKERLEGNFDPAVGGMTEERVAMLEKINFSWKAPLQDHSDTWNERLEDLREYKQEYGHCSVSYNHTGHHRLVAWIKNQRQHYRYYQKAKEKGEKDPRSKGMNEERIAILEALGFTWTAEPIGFTRRVR